MKYSRLSNKSDKIGIRKLYIRTESLKCMIFTIAWQSSCEEALCLSNYLHTKRKQCLSGKQSRPLLLLTSLKSTQLMRAGLVCPEKRWVIMRDDVLSTIFIALSVIIRWLKHKRCILNLPVIEQRSLTISDILIYTSNLTLSDECLLNRISQYYRQKACK
jgi:hypothetical protein